MWIASLLFLQDLFQRDPERFELRLAPAVVMPKGTRERASSSVDFADFAGLGFDPLAGLRSQFDKQVAQDFLAGLEGDLASNALVLACQVSPTICDAIKHFRVTSGQALSILHEQIQSMEQVLHGLPQKIRAGAILACLGEQAKKGRPIDRALEECVKAEGLRDLTGRNTREVDVLSELQRFLKLDDELASLLREIGQPVRIGARSASSEVNLGGIAEVFNRDREKSERTWREAVDSGSTKSVPLTPAELASLSALPKERRDAVIRSLSSAQTYVDLSARLAELERRIQAAETSPAAEELGPVLRQERDWIRSELGRLEDHYRRQVFFDGALSRALGVLDEELDRSFRARLGPAVDKADSLRAEWQTREWGAQGSEVKPEPGRGCGTCTTATWSAGKVRGK